MGLEDVRAHRQDRRRSRATPTSSTSPPRARCGAPAATAASTRPPTAARPGSWCSRSSENTGVTDVVIDPRDPDVLYAAAYQRRRHVWTLINGGPGVGDPQDRPTAARPGRSSSAGCPTVDMGRIGLAISPADPDVGLRHHRGGRRRGRLLPLDRRAARPGTKRATTSPAARSTTTRSSPIPHDADRVYSHGHLDAASPRTAARPSTQVGETHQARRQPRAVDRPRRHRPPARRLRRRRLRELRPRRDLALQGQPADHPVLPGRRRQRRARSTTSTAAPRTTTPSAARRAPPTHHGITNRDWFVTLGGDGFETAGRPEQPGHRLLPVAVRRPRRATTGKSGEVHRHPAPARARRGPAALELGLAADHQPALADAALLRRPAPLPQRRPRRLAGRRSAAT